MYERSSSFVLRWLKVPPEPHPPHGDPASLRTFRAGKNYFNLRLTGWIIAQLLAFIGIVFWLVVFVDIEVGVANRRQTEKQVVRPTSAKGLEEYLKKAVENDLAANGATAAVAQPAGSVAGREKKVSEVASTQVSPPSDGTVVQTAKPAETVAPPTTEPARKKRAAHNRITGWGGFRSVLVNLAVLLPTWAFPLLWALKGFGILVYLVQLPLTYAIRRLDYEMRWYMVTDRSLRIRHGVWKVAESTMSFANIQQVVVSQGPVQRLLGLADVKVQSAGGGSGHEHHQKGEDDMHLGLFRSVTNAPQIRDLILERLRRFRESGLGDPEEKSHHPPPAAAMGGPASPDLLAAARELAAEARALRVSLG